MWSSTHHTILCSCKPCDYLLITRPHALSLLSCSQTPSFHSHETWLWVPGNMPTYDHHHASDSKVRAHYGYGSYKRTWAFISGMSTRTSSPLPSSMIVWCNKNNLFSSSEVVEVILCVSGSVCLCIYAHVNGIVFGKVQCRDVAGKITVTMYVSWHAMFLKYNNILLTWKPGNSVCNSHAELVSMY